MAREISDYVALALISNIDWSDENPNFYSLFGSKEGFAGDLDKLRAYAEERTGLTLDDRIVGEAVRALADCGMLRITDDQFSGRYVKIRKDRLPAFIKDAADDLARARDEEGDPTAVILKPSDYPSASALLKHELFEDYEELGDEWLKTALIGIRKYQAEHGALPTTAEETVSDFAIPASDRFVTLDHNQQVELEAASDQVIEALEKENSVDGDSSVRAWMLGQLKAGRELIRAQTLNVWLLEQTILNVLGRLIEKYKDQAIGAAAKALLDLLIKHIFGVR